MKKVELETKKVAELKQMSRERGLKLESKGHKFTKSELIEKIEVHQSEKIDGKTVQRLTIHYTCVGVIDIPDLDKIPENNVSVYTRQGVDVHYAPCVG